MQRVTIGLDLGDRFSHFCVLSASGEVVEEGRVPTRRTGFESRFSVATCRVVLEVGTHSPWVSRLLQELGHEVIVANPRRLLFIYGESTKTDRVDAEQLARVGRLDPKLLHPIRHRKASSQTTLSLIRSRDMLVRTRTKLVNHVRGSVKPVGCRLRCGSTRSFAGQALAQLPESLRPSLEPQLEVLELISAKIRAFDKEIERQCEEEYPETQRLRQIAGVGPLTALTFVLVLEDPSRFRKSRDVGAFVGLKPKKDQSGNSDPQLGITKAGDVLLRRLLVQSAHYILGPFGQDSDLRRWGLGLCERGGKAAKKRATVAVARKLSVLLHCLWVSGETYEPLRREAA